MKSEWEKLHPNIRERFQNDPAPGEKIIYQGVMQTVRRSRMGWLFAHLTRIIGNPLTPYAGTDVAMDVTLYKRPDESGVYWQRTYYYAGKKPYVVTSVKRESPQGEMMECVGGGFGMLLKLSAENTRLHFKSYLYFWMFGGLRVPMPHWLTPGATHVIHEDLGDGSFKFTISMDHRQLGQTFYQEGLFRQKKL